MRSSPALLLLLAVGLALRLPWWIERPLWLDEALQYEIAAAPDWMAVLERSAAFDLHPPLFSVLSHGVLQGLDGEAGLRLLPLLAGLAAIPLAAWVGRSWLGPAEGLAFAALVATCPPLVFWSREGRPYALAVLGLLLWLGALGKLRSRPDRGWLLVAAAPMALVWHYGSWLVVPITLLPFAARRATRPAAGWAALAVAATLILHLPWLWTQVGLRGDSPHLQGFMGWGALSGLGGAAGWVVTGSSAPALTWLGGLGLLGALGWAAARRRERGGASEANGELLAVALLPVGAWIAAGLVGLYPVGPVRHALVFVPGVFLALSAWARLPQGALALGIGALGMGALAGLRAPGLPVEDLPAVIEALEPIRGEAPVWVHPRLGPAARHYGLRSPFEVGSWHHPLPPSQGWALVPADSPLPGTPSLCAPGVWAYLDPAPDAATPDLQCTLSTQGRFHVEPR